jgi:hypothetical protein
MSIGRVFGRAFSTIKHNPLVVLGVALTVVAIPTAAMTYVSSAAAMSIESDTMTGVGGVGFMAVMALSWVVSLLIGAIAQGALTAATVAESEGRRASFGESFSAAFPVLLPLIGVGLLYALGVAVGFILLIVPGIILMLMWAVAVPALIVERGGVFHAFRRSRGLTRGARWKILGAFTLLVVIYLLLTVALAVVGIQMYGIDAATGAGAANIIVTTLLSTLFTMLWGTVQPSIYLELRRWKEGTDVRSLEDVFA